LLCADGEAEKLVEEMDEELAFHRDPILALRHRSKQFRIERGDPSLVPPPLIEN
jgi:hypothetical protein